MIQQGSWVRVRVIQDDGVPDADVLQRPPVAVADGLVDGIQHLQAFAHLCTGAALKPHPVKCVCSPTRCKYDLPGYDKLKRMLSVSLDGVAMTRPCFRPCSKDEKDMDFGRCQRDLT